ncbi:hypothetical protein RchiOBHm_Chr5g0022241 [Rosa chinensis]|uniref:Uncharacterized protein n=1 Tax=Rosa chinensis TaxID=74649 RepID=A0A2P6Q7R7_ROSCH|nr:hypothetical protein RchiOBHm_Chr5g0022241 [Rosa chinensis]
MILLSNLISLAAGLCLFRLNYGFCDFYYWVSCKYLILGLALCVNSMFVLRSSYFLG